MNIFEPYGTCNHPCPREQRHVHEFSGSVMIAERNEDPHNHRFASVSGEAVGEGFNHVHPVQFRTDFYEEHFHQFCGTSSVAIPVGDGRHIHYLASVTDVSDGHRHEFKAASQIEDPIGESC